MNWLTRCLSALIFAWFYLRQFWTQHGLFTAPHRRSSVCLAGGRGGSRWPALGFACVKVCVWVCVYASDWLLPCEILSNERSDVFPPRQPWAVFRILGDRRKKEVGDFGKSPAFDNFAISCAKGVMFSSVKVSWNWVLLGLFFFADVVVYCLVLSFLSWSA